MQLYSTGEAARMLRVTRDSLHAALRTTAPDAANRIGNRRVFTKKEIEALEAWFDHRQQMRNGLLPRENEKPSAPHSSRRGENDDAQC